MRVFLFTCACVRLCVRAVRDDLALQGGKVHFVESFDSRLPDACVLNSPAYVIADEVEGT